VDQLFAHLSAQSEYGGVSTFHKAQRYSQTTPNQSSTLSLPNSATALTFLPKAGQTFQQATQLQPIGLYANQGWPRHKPDKLANIRQSPAFAQLSIQCFAAARARCRRSRQLDPKRIRIAPAKKVGNPGNHACSKWHWTWVQLEICMAVCKNSCCAPPIDTAKSFLMKRTGAIVPGSFFVRV